MLHLIPAFTETLELIRPDKQGISAFPDAMVGKITEENDLIMWHILCTHIKIFT